MQAAAAKLEEAMRSEADARQAVADATSRVADLAERAARLEGDLASERLQAMTDRRHEAGEARDLKDQVRTSRGEAAGMRKELESLRELRSRRSVRLAVRTSDAMRGAKHRITGTKPSAKVARGRRAPLPTAEQERRLADALAAQAPGSPRVDGPLVSLIVLNRNGRSHLRRLLPKLDETTYRSFELIVVDDASTDGSREELARGGPIALTLR